MSLAKSLAGRKRDSFVWDYYTFDEATGKSKCEVIVGDDRTCGNLFTGKNTSNLVAHLQRSHKQEYSEYTQHEQSKKCLRQGVKRQTECSRDGDTECRPKMQTLESCLQRRIVSWRPESNEHKERIRSVMDMLVDTNLPLTVIDHRSFRAMMKTMDAKFNLPGIQIIQ
jgi:hypothetical protein